MKKLLFSYEMKLTFSSPVWDNYFHLKCVPVSAGTQHIYEYSFGVDRADELLRKKDCFGNAYYQGRIMARQSSFRCWSKGMALVDMKPIPGSVSPLFEVMTDKTEPSPEMKDYFDAFLAGHTSSAESASSDAAGAEQRIALIRNFMAAFFQIFTYEQGVTGVKTTGAEAFQQKCGVCQDYAHILISFCRYVGIPARYVSGCMLGEGESHAWVEAFIGDSWVSFDPTHDRLCNDDFIVFARGRDAADCLINRGIFYGHAVQTQNIHVSVSELADGADGTGGQQNMEQQIQQ